MDVFEIEKEAACKAVKKYLDDYTEDIKEIQQSIRSGYKGIISAKLLENPNLSTREKDVLTRLKGSLDAVINRVAARMEEHRMDSYEDYSQRYKLNAYDRLRVDILINSVRNINISINKLKFAFAVLSYCNSVIINEFETCLAENNVVDGKKLVLGNLLIIFELFNYMINFLVNFKLEGVDDILTFSQKELDKIGTTMQDLQKLKVDANSDEINASVKDRIISNLNDREKSLELFKVEWDKYIGNINSVQEKVHDLGNWLPTFRLIRNNAQNQLDFFEIMKVFGIMMIADVIRKNLEPLRIDPLPLGDIELISLPPHRVFALIGLSQE